MRYNMISGSKKMGSDIFFFSGAQVLELFLAFFPGTICLEFATVWNYNLSFCMVFATFWYGYFAFCMVFAIYILAWLLSTFGHVCLPFCMVFVTFWHFNLSFTWYLLHFGTSNVHVDFLRVYGFFRVPCRDSKKGFLSGFPNVHVGFFRASLGFHLRIL